MGKGLGPPRENVHEGYPETTVERHPKRGMDMRLNFSTVAGRAN